MNFCLRFYGDTFLKAKISEVAKGIDFQRVEATEKYWTSSEKVYESCHPGFLFPRAMSQVPCLHEHLANAARVEYPAALLRCKIDAPSACRDSRKAKKTVGFRAAPAVHDLYEFVVDSGRF